MPTTTEILDGLTAIANDWIAVAIAWHVALAAALVAFVLGWRPPPRAAGLLVALLPASVAGFAVAYGNPFNGIVFAGLTFALVGLALGNRGSVLAPRWGRWAGIGLITFGWFYPHFLLGSPVQYLYAAPVGLVPCPSLAVAMGLALLLGGARAWMLILAGVATFYAVFGAVRLGVGLDVGLLVGAVLLVVSPRSASAATPRAPILSAKTLTS